LPNQWEILQGSNSSIIKWQIFVGVAMYITQDKVHM
jgi:hypothetical protein